MGSYVVYADSEKTARGVFWRPHLIIVFILLLASALAPAFTSKFAENESFRALLSAQAALSEHPSVTYADVTSGYSTIASINKEAETTTFLAARAILANKDVSNAELAEQLAKILVNSSDNSPDVDVIQIVLSYGYDIGITSSWTNHTHSFSPKVLTGEN